jgi:hypothetical protein
VALAINAEKGSLLKIADAIWVATALLHLGRPAQNAFTIDEIVEKTVSLGLTNAAEKSIRQHVLQHCEALSKPQPNRSRILYATRTTHRRLFRTNDRCHAGREGAPTHPEWSALPPEYDHLRHWYEEVWNVRSQEQDPLLAAIGTGREIWADQHADEYIAELRDWRMG